MKVKIQVLLTVVLLSAYASYSQNLPQIGAQVWIEPGDTDEEIDHWFKMLADHEMKTGRLFIMWNYVEPQSGEWDFSLYDKAFVAAEKYGVSIIATLTTNRRPAHRGDFYQLHGTIIESTKERLNESKRYIDKVVNHWKDHPALESWMLTNEAQQSSHFHPLALERYREWLSQKYKSIDQLNQQWSTWFSSFEEIEPSEAWEKRGYWNWEPAFLDWHTFWQNHLAWWLEWIASKVRVYDKKTDIHAHTGGITGNLAALSYDLPSWQNFTNTLGASIHPSWHFGLFERDQFPLAVSFCNELMRSASSPNPYWVTELQGGQNIFSGGAYPLTPTEQDIAQWTWVSIANNADKVVYWILNNRSKGFEVNEWSMLDFKGNPNERLKAAGQIANIISSNKDLFKETEKYSAPITILISLETMTHELYSPDNARLARSQDAHIISVYSYYQTFLEMGIPVNLKHINDFDWDEKSNHLAVIPHAMMLTENQADKIEQFVEKGNQLLVSGLTGMVDETSKSWVQYQWPLAEVIGAEFIDCRLIADSLSVSMQKPEMELPGVNWMGEIKPNSATVIGYHEERIAATENNFGNGRAIFIPTTLGLAAWTGSNEPLAGFLSFQYNDLLSDVPIRFKKKQNKAIIQTLRSGDKYIAVITNGSRNTLSADLEMWKSFEVRQICGPESALMDLTVHLGNMETIVLVLE
jgi:beta-galactosidase